MLEDTIVAISTPIGYGGLGVVRFSGTKALAIAKRLFKPKKKGSPFLPRQAILGNIYDFERKEFFDEGYLVFFPEPSSYTRENVVEISCHGSPVVLEEIVRLAIKAGARLAKPGEFTLRAYLRGRIDIIQAEAVNDLVRAQSLTQARVSYRQLTGTLSRKVASLREKIVHLLAQIEASIEFPDEGLRVSPGIIARTIENMLIYIRKLVASYDVGKILREGMTLALVGRTNVGKSTLFNALLEEERAIVTPFPGTTRDYLKERIKIKDSNFTLVDMAGLDLPSNEIEKEGMRKGKEIASQADGILLLLDASRPENDEDLKLLRKFRGKKTILLFNKIDLPQKINREKIISRATHFHSLDISALRKINLDILRETIHDYFVPPKKDEEEIVLHLRQKLILEEMVNFGERALSLLREGHPEEVYAEEVRKMIPLIGEFSGEIRAEEVIEDIFSRFCVGK